MPATWFVGDLHFGHEKVAELRGFDTIEAHDATIQRQWTRQVAWGDTVWVLGDISSGGAAGEIRALDILTGLPGRKRLIVGNHDSVAGVHRSPSPRTRLFRDVFETINDYGRIRINGESIYLSHFPYESQGDGPGRGEHGARYLEYRLPDIGHRLIHAHTHHTNPTSGSSPALGVGDRPWREGGVDHDDAHSHRGRDRTTERALLMSFPAKYDGVCTAACGHRIHVGDEIEHDGDTGFRHVGCTPKPSKYELGPREVVCPDCWLVKPCRCDE